MAMTRLVLTLCALLAGPALDADEPVKAAPPTDNRPDEPAAKQFSLDRAATFLDAAALDWNKTRGCFSCHTNYAYLYARPLVSAKNSVKAPAHAEVRKALEDMVAVRWQKNGPRWPAEVVASAAALAFNDAHTTGKLHPLTRTALDRMWTLQRPDGGWDWIKCNWPPMENDDHYGVTLAALAVGVAPESYAQTPAARKGLAGIRAYLEKNPPQNLHHRAMILWAGTHLDGFVSADDKGATIRDLLAKQRPDGGWNSASLGTTSLGNNWKRADRKEQDFETSDGYATGLTIYLLRRAGRPADEPALRKGVAWLKANQRESGRWFTRSLNRDNKHYLSHVGTAFAVMALAQCE